jgi:hypothetical protein
MGQVVGHRVPSKSDPERDGTDQIFLGGNTYRVSGIVIGFKLAFKTTGATGSVYITQEA